MKWQICIAALLLEATMVAGQQHISSTCEGLAENKCEKGNNPCVWWHDVCYDDTSIEDELCVIAMGNGNKYRYEIDCAAGLTCSYEYDPGTATEFEGTCVPEDCGGLKDNESGKPASEDESTIRVTICHRTCSETNPWVRITIDDDAWNGTDASGCGHLQHDVREDCNLEAKDVSIWAPQYKDYLIKWHGTKKEVAAGKNAAEEKAYWKKWERACPYVRRGSCCTVGVDCCGPEMYTETGETSYPAEIAVNAEAPDTPAPSPPIAPGSTAAPVTHVDIIKQDISDACHGVSESDCEHGNSPCFWWHGHCYDDTSIEDEICVIAMGNGNKYRYDIDCAAGFTCSYEFDPGTDETAFDGICVKEDCGGLKDNENGKPAAEDPGTVRVTICHRTCSETNPWVRITIDDDAWGGADASGCGHQLQHDVREDCNLEAKDVSVWAPQYKDYLIKNHGTKAFVASTRTTAQEKAYWREWERACPYVRRGSCCTIGVDCCGPELYSGAPTSSPILTQAGGTPSPTPGPTASPTTTPIATTGGIKVFKTVWKGGKAPCANGSEMEEDYQDKEVTYCYYAENTGTDSHADLDSITITDAPLDAIDPDTDPDWSCSFDGVVLAPGESTDFCPPRTSKIFPVLVNTHATVLGRAVDHNGVLINTIGANGWVMDSDPAGVKPLMPTCDILMYKTVHKGKLASCSDGSELVTDHEGEDVTYCYKAKVFAPVDGSGCMLADITITDDPLGETDFELMAPCVFPGPYGPGEMTPFCDPRHSKIFNKKVETPGTATGNPVWNDGTDITGYPDVSHSDPAGVEPELPSCPIKMHKTVHKGILASCSTGEDLVEDWPDEDVTYCYQAQNDAAVGASACSLGNVVITDPDLDGIDGGSTACAFPNLILKPQEMTPFCNPVRPSKVKTTKVETVAEAEGTPVWDDGSEIAELEVQTDTDLAGVVPMICDFDMNTRGSELCLPQDGVALLETKTASGDVVPAGFVADDLLFNIVQNGDMTVSFKVDNPFSFPVDMYVQKHVFAAGSVNGALDADCEKSLQEPGCNESTELVTAACIENGAEPFSIVSVFYVSNNAEITGEDSDAEPYECCHQDVATKTPEYGIIEYTYKVLCACPMEARRAMLRKSPLSDLEAWNKAIGR